MSKLTNVERIALANNLAQFKDGYNRVSVSKINKSSLSGADKQQAIIELETLIADMKAANIWRIDLGSDICYLNVQHWEQVDVVDDVTGVVSKKTNIIMSNEDFDIRNEMRLLAGRLQQYSKDGINNDNTKATQRAYDALVDRVSKWTSAVELHFTAAKAAVAA